MNEVGLHIGYWWGSGLEKNYDTLIHLTAGAGMDIIEIVPGWILAMNKEERREFAKKLAANGLRATVNGGLLPENDISSDDAAARKAGIEYCKRVLLAISDIGADIWSGVNFSAWLRKGTGEDAQEEKKRAWAHSVSSMKNIIKTAEDLGICYCFEVVNRYEQFLFNTAQEAVRFALEVDSPNASILLDSYHMNMEEDDVPAALSYAIGMEKMGHYHAGESNRRIPGVGPSHMDWESALGTLVNKGYRGAIVMEPFVLTAAHNAFKTCTWRQMCQHTDIAALQADAKTGGEFLRNQIQTHKKGTAQ